MTDSLFFSYRRPEANGAPLTLSNQCQVIGDPSLFALSYCQKLLRILPAKNILLQENQQ